MGSNTGAGSSTPERIKSSIITPTLSCATPGDLSLVLPYRQMTAIIEMLYALDKIAPGTASRYTLLYGIEVKFYSGRVKLTKDLETEGVKNLYAIGDGAGVTRARATSLPQVGPGTSAFIIYRV